MDVEVLGESPVTDGVTARGTGPVCSHPASVPSVVAGSPACSRASVYAPGMPELFSLGRLYPSDFLKPDEQPRCEPVELKLMFDEESSRVHLAETADDEFMWGRYWYRSGTNATMTNELAGIVDSITRVKTVEPGDVWLDIACNDGTLLRHVPPGVIRIGIDPADDSFLFESRPNAEEVIQAPFSADVWRSNRGSDRAAVVTCIAMFYDLADPKPFLDDVHTVLEDDGLFVMQMSYTPLMLRQVAFDNICHEHVQYYSLNTIEHVLEASGFRIVDCQLNDINGGSFRVYAMKSDADVTRFGTQPYRDVCEFRVAALRAHETTTGVNTPEVWIDFFERIEKLKTEVVGFIEAAKDHGKTVWAYGASTKGNTLLQYFGLDHTMIDAIAERSPYKFGLRTVGTNIPIVDEIEMRDAQPDYALVLPWHFINEFTHRERDYLEAGGQFIVPCPEFRIIGADG